MATWWPSNFQEFSEQVQASFEGLAEQGAVQLGILGPADVGDSLSSPEVQQCFVAEACALRQSANRSSVLLGCGAPAVLDGHVVSGGPSNVAIDTTVRRWLARLQKEGRAGEVALDAILRSLALEILLKDMVNSKDGRDAIRAASESPPTPLRLLLRATAAIPDGLLEQFLRVLADTANAAACPTREKRGVRDEDVGKQTLDWVLRLMSASLHEATEVQLCKIGAPALSVQRARERIAASGGCPESTDAADAELTCEQRLDAARYLGQSFNELKLICQELDPKNQEQKEAAAKKRKRQNKTTASSRNNAPKAESETPNIQPCCDDAIAALSALLSVLTELRAVNARRRQGDAAPQALALVSEVGALSVEVEKLVAKRVENVEVVKRDYPEVAENREIVTSLCIQAEETRRNHYEVVLAELEKSLWGAGAYYIQEDKQRLKELRALVGQSLGHLNQVGREMVTLAAECLANEDLLGIDSEEISKVATRYKEMRTDLQANLTRIGKMEDGGVGKPAAPKVQPKSATAAMASTSSPSQTRATAPNPATSSRSSPPKTAAPVSRGLPQEGADAKPVGAAPAGQTSDPPPLRAKWKPGGKKAVEAPAPQAAVTKDKWAKMLPGSSIPRLDDTARAAACAVLQQANASGILSSELSKICGVKAMQENKVSPTDDWETSSNLSNLSDVQSCPKTYWESFHARFGTKKVRKVEVEKAAEVPEPAPEVVSSTAEPIKEGLQNCSPDYWKAMHAQFPSGAPQQVQRQRN